MKTNVFKEIGFSDAESTVLKIKADLICNIRKQKEKKKLTQSEFAKLVGVSQPIVSKILRANISGMSIEFLINVLSKSKA